MISTISLKEFYERLQPLLEQANLADSEGSILPADFANQRDDVYGFIHKAINRCKPGAADF